MSRPRLGVQSLILLRLPSFVKWAATVTVVIGAYLLRAQVFVNLPALPLLFFLPAILFSAIFFGARFGLFATLLSALISAVFFLPPFGQWSVEDSGAALSLLLLVLTGALITTMGSALRGAYLKVEELQRHTAQAYAEAEAARALAQKGERDRELLLIEFEHRVKNDMQRAVATLNLQAANSPPDVAEALKQAANQITVITAMHDRLGHHAGAVLVEMAEYLDDLASGLRGSLAGTRLLEITVSANRCQLSLDQASAVGLITNELVTNAIKHAFPDNQSGNICIEFVRKEHEFVLTVSDDGVGLDQDTGMSGRRRGGLGRKLTTALAKQLGGDLVTGRAEPSGVSVQVSFPAASAQGDHSG